MTPAPTPLTPTKRWYDAPPHTLFLYAVGTTALAFSTLVAAAWRLVPHLAAGGGPSRAVVDQWSVLGSLATVVAVAITMGGGLLLWAQLVQSRRERAGAAFTAAFMLLMREEQIEARRWVYGLPDDVEAARAAIRDEVNGPDKFKRVVNSLDYLGFLVAFYSDADAEVIAWTSPIVRKTWAKLHGVIAAEAHEKQEADYYAAARELAARCADYDRRAGTTGWKYVKGAL